jgi:holo-[acyl-carrier protein] synthase
MDKEAILAALSKISKKKQEHLQPHLSLASLGVSSSFGLSALRSLLEAQSNVKLPPFNANLRVGDFIALLSGAEPAAARDSPSQSNPPTIGNNFHSPANGFEVSLLGAIGLGIDMQNVASLPIATDYRTHEFYVAHFTPEEIATSVLRPDPRAHLCGVFCAKEAAKKSRHDLLNLRMTDFYVTHDSSGRPALHLAAHHHLRTRFQFLLSITHTAEYAAAACLTLARGPG